MAEVNDAELEALRTRADAADSAAAAATQAAADADAARAQLNAGVERFRATVAAQNPDVPADAITGDTFDAVEASAQQARRIADAAVAAAAQARPPAAASVPAGGANTRDQAPDTEGMSPAQKVRAGLALGRPTGSQSDRVTGPGR